MFRRAAKSPFPPSEKDDQEKIACCCVGVPLLHPPLWLSLGGTLLGPVLGLLASRLLSEPPAVFLPLCSLRLQRTKEVKCMFSCGAAVLISWGV